ncbi:MAG TPA: hypothetical protein PKE20_11530, partial [Promineifilum sp.]|nr:hypothetical protein [Promineifilum sp.]
RWVGRRQPTRVSWLWAINGVTSVLGSALATALSIHIGFRLTLVIATMVYAAAAVLFVAVLSRAATEDEEATGPSLPGGPGKRELEPA